jgi:hypothetical protein
MKRCKICGREEIELPISRRGFCPHCAYERWARAVTEISKHHGPHYEKWLEAMKQAIAREEEKWKRRKDMCK